MEAVETFKASIFRLIRWAVRPSAMPTLTARTAPAATRNERLAHHYGREKKKDLSATSGRE